MGQISVAQIDAHLCAGGTVVAASDRASRAILASFNESRRGEGREAWFAPKILDWSSFVRHAWEDRTSDLRLPMSALQEQALWERIIHESAHSAALLDRPRRNLAAMSMRAHALLCSYAPRFLEVRARGSWEQDAAVFSRWLSAFDTLCRDERVISANQLAVETIPLLRLDRGSRPVLLLAAFDRLVPIQRELFDAWGGWERVAASETAGVVQSFTAPDPDTELAACATWCRQRISVDPQRRMLIIAQDIRERRGQFERAFLAQAAADPNFQFEFSLGVPLSQTPPVRSAQLLLRWLDGELAEHELDWLFSTPRAGSHAESAALRARMHALRNRGMQRPQWTLRAFLDQPVARALIPDAWKQRVRAAQKRMQDVATRELSPMEWAEMTPSLLESIGWPGASASTSAEFQVARRWQRAVEACGSLGFDGRRMNWQAFLSELLRITDETLFAPESENSPILVAGPAESAGITADAVWFMGADDDGWPARGDTLPLLPMEVQRGARMPHSSPQVDWDLAHAITARLLTSAREVYFSHAQSREGVELRPSRLVAEFAGAPNSLSQGLRDTAVARTLTIAMEDGAAIAFPGTCGDTPIQLRGGSALLTAQSQCAFKAFAIGRLAASSWEPAEAALTAAERGQLLHAVLRTVWEGPPHGIRSLDQLQNIPDLRSFVAPHVQRALANKTLSRVRDDMPTRYFDLEAMRLAELVTEWLSYERTRVSFEVIGTERDKTKTIAGLSLDLRLDRLDRLNDGTLLVVDYKTGDVSPKSWDLPRPDDVQLPLYAGFGLDEGEFLGGLVFAKVRRGEMCFAGRVVDASSTIDSSLKSTTSLEKYPLTAEQLMDWRDVIEQLARDFLAGRADVDPRDAPKTCERCGLHTICRIQERKPMIDHDEAEVSHE